MRRPRVLAPPCKARRHRRHRFTQRSPLAPSMLRGQRCCSRPSRHTGHRPALAEGPHMHRHSSDKRNCKSQASPSSSRRTLVGTSPSPRSALTRSSTNFERQGRAVDPRRYPEHESSRSAVHCGPRHHRRLLARSHRRPRQSEAERKFQLSCGKLAGKA